MSALTDRDRLEIALSELRDLPFAASTYIEGLLTDYVMSEGDEELRIVLSKRQRNAGHFLVSEVSARADAVREMAVKLMGYKDA